MYVYALLFVLGQMVNVTAITVVPVLTEVLCVCHVVCAAVVSWCGVHVCSCCAMWCGVSVYVLLWCRGVYVDALLFV